MKRTGSISLGLIVALCVGSAAVGGGAGWFFTSKRADKRLSEVQGRTEALSVELGECRAAVTQESLQVSAQGTTDALTVALAPELAEVQARAELVRAIPRAEITSAIIATGSPRLIAAESWMARCEAMQAIKETDRLGCGSAGQAVSAYQAALEAQAACPTPSTPVLELAPPTVTPTAPGP